MNKKRKARRKRVLIAYTLRIAAVTLVGIILFLMFCGCLYIRDFLRDRSDSNTHSAQAAQMGNGPDNTEIDKMSGQMETEDGMRVVLDAGHGGNDGGTIYGAVNEKDITLAVVMMLKEKLEQKGVQVTLTRQEDEYLSLEQRSAAANASSADIFVSLHCNYYEDDFSISGLESYYLEQSVNGKALAQSITDAVSEDASIECRGIKTENFYVLKNTNIPAVLIELGFLSNKSERQKLQSEDYQTLLAEKISKGIMAHLNNKTADQKALNHKEMP